MGMVTMTLTDGARPTDEQITEIEEAAKRDIVYTEDAPELTDDQLSEFIPANPKYYKPVKELISLRLDSILVDAFKSTGKGYQTKINEALWRGAAEMGIVKKSST